MGLWTTMRYHWFPRFLRCLYEIFAWCSHVFIHWSWAPPPATLMGAMLTPYTRLYRAKTHSEANVARIPRDKPIMFVCNHSTLGLEIPLTYHALLKVGRWPRAIGDYSHFLIPVWGQLLQCLGVFNGTRDKCHEIMKSKQDILVYPGGAREVLKRTTDSKYEIMWKERVGFARLAIYHGYTIIPLVVVGTEDIFDVKVDIPLDKVFPKEVTGRRGLTGPVLFPSSWKALVNRAVDISFAKPIETEKLMERKEVTRTTSNNEKVPNAPVDAVPHEVCVEVRDQTRDAVLRTIEEFRAKGRGAPVNDEYLDEKDHQK